MSTMTNPISNTDDVIDSRDVIARIDHLREAWTESSGEEWSDYQLSEDDWALHLGEQDAHELVALTELAELGESSADWPYGETLIHDNYFEDYARELAEEIGAVPTDNKWPTYCIDWKWAARELRHDYTSVDFDGQTYWIRA